MKRIFLLYILILPLHSYGQLFTLTDHYMHNAIAINPAYSGSHDALSTIFSYRNCLNNFEGSPSTLTLSMHASLNHDKVGLGLFTMSDKYGVSNKTSFIGNYAYRMDAGSGKLAIGLGFGMVFSRIDWNNLAAHDAEDELLTEQPETAALPNFSIGMYYSTKKYFMGLSLPLFLSHEYDTRTDKYNIRNDFKAYNYLLNAGYIFDLNPAVKFFPSALVKYNMSNASQIDITSQFIFHDKVWVGVTYRSRSSLVGILQCQVNKQIRIAYSYDFIFGGNEMYKFNSHEIMLNYVLVNNVVASNPRQF